MEASLDMSLWKEPEDVKSKEQLSLPSHEDHLNDVNIDPEQDSTTTAVVESEAMVAGTNSVRNSPVDYYGDESVKIVAGAARLKRAEIMATTVNSSGSLISKGAVGKASVDAEILRSFLVSLSEDWRALVIRSAACLYRLKGITDDLDSDDVLEDGTNDVSTGSSELTRSTNVVARDAFKVYAPLAQRLGMHRLKSELENRAFRILYPR
jgi:(p)ppGpp synthase/HD superfamily hydrolase